MLAIALLSKSLSEPAVGRRCFRAWAERCQNAGSWSQSGSAGAGALPPCTLPETVTGRQSPSMQCLQPPPMGRCSLAAPDRCQPAAQLCTGHRPPATGHCPSHRLISRWGSVRVMLRGALTRGTPSPSPLPTGGSSLVSLGDILQGPSQ